MKKMILVLAIMFAGFFQSETKAGYGEVNFNYFYHNLNAYGEWIEIDYDVVVWRPYNVSRNWSPYSVGNWEYTGYGWYWNSYEPFGWATYHYGRWYYDDYYQWVWVPGYEWGPSWVEWRYSDSYIGWSPLPPYADFRIRVGIYFSVNYRTSYHYWNFVTYNRFCDRNVHLHYVDVYHKNRIFNNTKYRTNYYADRGRIINGGVDRNYVERRSGNRITEREVQRTTNLRDYTGSRGNVSSDRLVTYQPDEREVQKYKNVEVNRVNRAEGKSTLKRDAVTFRDEERKTREEIRNGVQTTKRDPGISSDDRQRTGEPNINIERKKSVREKKVNRTPNVEQKREVKTRESYQVPRKVETYTPTRKAETGNKSNSSTSSSRNNSTKSTSVNRSSSNNNSRSISKPTTSKREVSKSNNSSKNSTPKKKRN